MFQNMNIRTYQRLILGNKNTANVYFLLKKSTIRLCKSSENLTLLYSQHNS